MSESDSFEQGRTEGISEQVDALKGFLDEQGLAGGSSPAESSGGEGAGERGRSSDGPDGPDGPDGGGWTSHAGEAPEHRPVAVDDPETSGDTRSPKERASEGGWEPVTAPDGEEIDESGGSSDGSESGQDAGSMS